jgi:peroxiredoxin
VGRKVKMPAKYYPFKRKLRETCIFLLLFILGLIQAKAQKAIDFTLKDLDGDSQRLSDYFQKNVILIDFWATWCIPCVKELPHFQRFYDKYKEKGLVVLAITVDGPETVAMVKPFVKSHKYNFPVLLDTESKVIALYDPRVILPYTILIDRQGKIKHVHQGYSLGDEKVIEEEILELLEPKEEVKGKRFSFYLNEAFLNRNFSDRDYVDRIREGRKSQIINQLDLSLTLGDFLAGVRGDANLDFSPLKENYRLAKRFFEINKRDFNLRAGDFYYSVGRGLIFSVLKTFEKEGLEYIIDTTVDGGKFTLSQKQFSAEIFGGWLDREDSNLKDKVYGGTLGWRYRDRADFKINFLGSQLESGSAYGNKNVFIESASLDIPNLGNKAKCYGEFLLIQKRKFYDEEGIDGHGIYLESGLFMGNLSVLFEFKDYKNLDFEYNRPPLLESEQLPLLANQFAKDARDVTGLSSRLDYNLPKISTLLFGKLSYLQDRPGGHLRNIIHFFAGLEKKFKDTGWLNFIGGYREEDTSSLVFYYTHGSTFHYQLNISYPLTSRLSLEADFKSKDFRGRYLDYYERSSFLSVHYSPRWIATLFFDQTNDPEILFFKDKKDWLGGQIEIKFSHANSVRIFYGSNKGGVKCSGGVCKFFPPFEGLRIDAIFRF